MSSSERLLPNFNRKTNCGDGGSMDGTESNLDSQEFVRRAITFSGSAIAVFNLVQSLQMTMGVLVINPDGGPNRNGHSLALDGF